MDDLQKARIRSLSYWYVDGAAEIGAGIVITLTGLFYLLLSCAPENSSWGWVLGLGQPVIVIGSFFLVSAAVRAFKERVTYPRTGYVSYIKRAASNRLRRGILAGSLAAGISILMTLFSGVISHQWVPLLIGALLSLMMVILAVNYGVRRFYALAAIILALGAGVAWLNVPTPLDTGWMFTLFGLSWIVSGAITLARYLATTQPANLEDLG